MTGRWWIVINVDIHPGRIAVMGHAGAGEPGHDIVCAAVSALVQTLQETLEQRCDTSVSSAVAPGKAVFTWDKLTTEADLLTESLIIGLSGIEESYPNNLHIN